MARQPPRQSGSCDRVGSAYARRQERGLLFFFQEFFFVANTFRFSRCIIRSGSEVVVDIVFEANVFWYLSCIFFN